ncbi:MAG: hypothetical protein P4L55_02585 [Syntrophobacteraceae bacterium]|nr:hypothetical protein [Syntrophobacteraceae bacterium]
MDQKLYVYQDANLNKQIKALLKGGANSAPAARHAQSIIEQFINGGILNLKNTGRYTRHGDARIKNCLKFDLVRSYRLVAVLVESGIAFLYVGSHAECDHWIKHNAWAEPNLDKKRNTITEIAQRGCSDESIVAGTDADEFEPDYDALIFRDISEQDLRLIFSGLCRK